MSINFARDKLSKSEYRRRRKKLTNVQTRCGTRPRLSPRAASRLQRPPAPSPRSRPPAPCPSQPDSQLTRPFRPCSTLKACAQRPAVCEVVEVLRRQVDLGLHAELLQPFVQLPSPPRTRPTPLPAEHPAQCARACVRPRVPARAFAEQAASACLPICCMDQGPSVCMDLYGSRTTRLGGCIKFYLSRARPDGSVRREPRLRIYRPEKLRTCL